MCNNCMDLDYIVIFLNQKQFKNSVLLNSSMLPLFPLLEHPNLCGEYENSTDEIFFLEQELYICFSNVNNLKKNLENHSVSYVVAFLPSIIDHTIIDNIGLPYIIQCDDILDKKIFDTIINNKYQTLVFFDKTNYKQVLPFLVYFLTEYHSNIYRSIGDALIRILNIIDKRIKLNEQHVQDVCRLL